MARIVRRWTGGGIETIRLMHAANKPLYVIADKAGRSVAQFEPFKRLSTHKKVRRSMPKRMPDPS